MVAHLAESTEYQYGFHDDNTPLFKAKRGLSRRVVEEISDMKDEPDWMRTFRLRALEMFERRPMPTWGSPALADLVLHVADLFHDRAAQAALGLEERRVEI